MEKIISSAFDPWWDLACNAVSGGGDFLWRADHWKFSVSNLCGDVASGSGKWDRGCGRGAGNVNISFL